MNAKDRINQVLRRGVKYAEVSLDLAVAGDFNGSNEAAMKALENIREAIGLRADIVDGKLKLTSRVSRNQQMGGLCQGCERLPEHGAGYCDVCRKILHQVWNGERTQTVGDLRIYAAAAIEKRLKTPKPPGKRWGDGGDLCNVCGIAPAVSVGICTECRQESKDFPEIPKGYRCSQCHTKEGFYHKPDCRGERKLLRMTGAHS